MHLYCVSPLARIKSDKILKAIAMQRDSELKFYICVNHTDIGLTI
ncbi:MAG: hypothetical protein SAK29_24465 [Scytonema sp. PMC 1069.18]|nr:hypothetical protein [Scytonema sp. PMC 1069.18]MEC4887721.1 hypothetical protein [Scytonema sp. PMC 1070.18]